MPNYLSIFYMYDRIVFLGLHTTVLYYLINLLRVNKQAKKLANFIN